MRRHQQRGRGSGMPSLSSLRTMLIVVGAVLLLALNFSKRESPYLRRQRLKARRAQEGSAAAAHGNSLRWGRGAVGLSTQGLNSTASEGASLLDDSISAGALEGSAAKVQGSSSLQPYDVGSVKLYNGVTMPRIGLGTAGLGAKTEQAVLWALEEGYRLFDSAQAREWYREDLVGAAIKHANVSRKQVFLVSKLHPRHMGYTITLERFEDSLRDLGVTYVDLFLLHYPWCFPEICGAQQPAGAWHDSWRAFEELYRRGKTRAIGVSNFGEEELKELLKQADVKPHVLQRNSDPLRADNSIQKLCKENNIAYMAYSSLGTQWQFQTVDMRNPVLAHPTIKAIGERVGCSTAQVVLAWGLAKGQIVIPRSSNRKHIRENLRAGDCKLTEENLRAIDALDGTGQTEQ